MQQQFFRSNDAKKSYIQLSSNERSKNKYYFLSKIMPLGLHRLNVISTRSGHLKNRFSTL